MKKLFQGLSYALLSASSAIAGKYGLQQCDPFMLVTLRFLLAGILLLLFCHGLQRLPFPNRKQLFPLIIISMLNSLIYLTAFFYALQHLSTGLSALFTALIPLAILFFSAVFMKRTICRLEWVGMTIASLGICISTFPELLVAGINSKGLIATAISIISAAAGTIYLTRKNLELPLHMVNGWQLFIAGILLFPLVFLIRPGEPLVVNTSLMISVLWLSAGVSIAGMQLWLLLLKSDPVRAGQWIYLVPVFGYFLGFLFYGEPISVYSAGGTLFVIGGLFLASKKSTDPECKFPVSKNQ